MEMYLEMRTLTALDYLCLVSCLGALQKSSKAHSLEDLECQLGHQGYAQFFPESPQDHYPFPFFSMESAGNHLKACVLNVCDQTEAFQVN